MKINQKLVTIFIVLFAAFNMNAQVAENKIDEVLVNKEQTIELDNSQTGISNIESSSWFIGAKQQTNQSLSENEGNKGKSALISKKEQYLQSGLSNKTLLIRSILKKADSYTNATV